MTNNTLFAQIEASKHIDDLDKAIRPIQDILGQDDGHYASIFFDGFNSWESMPLKERRFHLIKYVGFELELLEAYGEEA